MEFFETVRTRRSIRKYTPKAIPDDVMNKALDAALLAPNSSNMQPWEFYWVRQKDTRRKLVSFCFSQLAARTASEIIVVVARRDHWKRNQRLMLAQINAGDEQGKDTKIKYYSKLVPLVYTNGLFDLIGLVKWIAITMIGWFRPVPRGPFSTKELFNVLNKSTALACENFMLAMTAQGFGTCPMEGFDESRVKKLLGLNRHCRVVMVISCGEPAEDGIFGEQIRFDRNLFIKQV